jgi:KRAB domain-containing zinc finger protein
MASCRGNDCFTHPFRLQAFAKLVDLRSHKRETHEPAPEFRCDFCGLALKSKFNLKVRLKSFCVGCRIEKLQGTLHINNNPEIPRKCHLIYKASRTIKARSELEWRIVPVSCTFGCLFPQAHSLIHTGTKSFLCDECGRGFLRRKPLQDHIAAKHATSRAYPCPEEVGRACPDDYSSNSNIGIL